jgi:predicted nucleic acid-binding Zn ribbon protein
LSGESKRNPAQAQAGFPSDSSGFSGKSVMGWVADASAPECGFSAGQWCSSEAGGVMKRSRKRQRTFDALMLAVDANRVIGLRLAKLMLGGKGAQREATLMVAEKVAAAIEAGGKLMTGASGDDIVRLYRRRVASNAKRLSRLKSPAPSRRRRRK